MPASDPTTTAIPAMPKSSLGGTLHNVPLRQLAGMADLPLPLRPGERRVLGYRLPPFQRPAVWTEAQQVSFIESAWRGFSLGQLVVTETDSAPHLNRYLIDGQQRLTAIEAYFQNRLTVFGARHSELQRTDQLRLATSVSIGVLSLRHHLTMARLQDLYVQMNWGGTAHQEHDRPPARPT